MGDTSVENVQNVAHVVTLNTVDVRTGSTKTKKMGCFNFQTLEASPYPFNLSNVKNAFFISYHGVR